MDDPNALGDRMNERSFILGMRSSTFIIVRKDNDISTREEGFAAGWKTIASTTEGDGERPKPDNGVNVLFPLRPIKIIRHDLTIEGVDAAEVGNFSKSIWLASLPARTPITVFNAVPIHGTTTVHDLDPDGQRFAPINMTANFICSDRWAFDAPKMECGLSFGIWRRSHRQQRLCRFRRWESGQNLRRRLPRETNALSRR